MSEFGGPSVLKYEEAPNPSHSETEAVVKLSAIGVNYRDIYERKGAYHSPLPLTPGVEGAGEVLEVGSRVTTVKPGDPVVSTRMRGAYAEYALADESKLVRVPRGLDMQTAAAVMLQGLTAHYLALDVFPVARGHRVLIHAGAGGVGALLIQMTKRAGAQVIATVSTESKAKIAREAGADEVIIYTDSDFEKEVKALTGGLGVNVVYDSVGKTTFEGSLSCLSPRGILAAFGESSGPPPPFTTSVLRKGSLFVTRPGLEYYTATHEELERRTNDVFSMVLEGALKVRVTETLPLSQAEEAHRQLEGRLTTGKVLLTP